MTDFVKLWLARLVRDAERGGEGGDGPSAAEGAQGAADTPGTSSGEGAGGDGEAASPPADQGAGGDAAKADGDDPLGWLGVDLDEKTRKGLLDTQTTTPEKMLKRMQAAEKMIRGNVLEAPPSDAEGRAAWLQNPAVREKLGIPESVEGYDLSPPEIPEDLAPLMDWSTEREQKVAEALHGLGLSKEQYQGARQAYLQVLTEQVKLDLAEAVADRESTFGALRQEWGDAYDERMRLAAETARSYGVDQAKAEALRRGQVIGGAELLKLLADAGMAKAEDGALIGGNAGRGGQKTPAEWQREADAYGQEHAGALQDAQHPEHGRRVQEWNALRRNARGGR